MCPRSTRPLLIVVGALLIPGPPALVFASGIFQVPLPGVDFIRTEVSYNPAAMLLTWPCGTVLLASLLFLGLEHSPLKSAETSAILAVSFVFPAPFGITSAALLTGFAIPLKK